MRCPRCGGQQIQREYDNGDAVARIAGIRKLLCITCGNVFHGFDLLRKLPRVIAKRDAKLQNRRRSPRFRAHLPAAISLIEPPSSGGKASYSEASHGHCEALNEFGLCLSLVGSRFPERELTRVGCLLFVRLHLPEVSVESVVSVVNHQRVGEGKKARWFLGVKLHQISDEDKANLIAYLKTREREQPLAISND
jgi:hypothetical protein